MTRTKVRFAAWGIAFLGVFAAVSIVGCKKDDSNDPPVSSAPMAMPGGGGGPMGGGPMGGGGPGAAKPIEEKGPFVAGIKVFNANRCGMCHTVTGEAAGNPMPGGPPKGPDLLKVGADATHTRAWLAVQIRNPKEHKANSRMPQQGADKINDADLEKLIDFLASLK